MYSKTPFGEPDGYNLRFDEVRGFFVQNDYGNFTSIITDETCRKIRIIIGEKGSGKTVYLKRYGVHLKHLCSDKNDIFVSFCDSEPPSTELVQKINESIILANITSSTIHWSKLWKCALIRSLLGAILYNRELTNYVDDSDKKILRSFMGKGALIPDVKCERDVFRILNDILANLRTLDEINRYVDHPCWDELDVTLCNLLRSKLPKIYLLIDGIDEFYLDAPTAWTKCQAGLFYRAWKMMGSQFYEDMFNVVISVRKSVFYRILRENDNSSKYENSGRILMLNWSKKSIRAFFEEKISLLDSVYFREDGYPKNLTRWLGVNTIHDEKLNKEESVMDYILRHICLLPRDIIRVGNELSAIKQEISEDYTNDDVIQLIRDKVYKTSSVICDDILKTCEIHALSAANCNSSRLRIEEFEPCLKDILYDSIKNMETAFVTEESLMRMQEYITREASEQLKLDINPKVLIDCLWQNGCIGFIKTVPNKSDKVICFADFPSSLSLPKHKNKYVFSSFIKDYIGLKDA